MVVLEIYSTSCPLQILVAHKLIVWGGCVWPCSDVPGSIVTGAGLLTEGSYSATPLVINVEAATTQASSTAVIYPAQSERNVIRHANADATTRQMIFKVNDLSHTLEDDPIAIPVPWPGDKGTYMLIGAVDGPNHITNTHVFLWVFSWADGALHSASSFHQPAQQRSSRGLSRL